MLCVLILCISGGIYSLIPIANNRFITIFYLRSEFCQKSVEKKSPEKYFLLLVISDMGFQPRSHV